MVLDQPFLTIERFPGRPMNRFFFALVMMLAPIFLAGCLSETTNSGHQADQDTAQSKTGSQRKTGHGSTAGKAQNEAARTAEQGRKDAVRDIAAGNLLVWTMPLPSPPWAIRHLELVRAKGIDMKSTRTVDEFKTEYIQAYNRRMTQELDRKFGPNLIERLESQARDNK